MRPYKKDMVNAPDLLCELNHATAWMMALPIELLGSEEWNEAVVRQQKAFLKWRKYIYGQAYGSRSKQLPRFA
ncbi:hypothetical protein [Pseudomonas sp. LP_7_YM]|uniref:hypothetical protein n=1 Tax=Pseudomonas sp. LP_7_YM TaxID=2485137 RepID=UPI00105F2E04|nr:hypothetical protein [Pseudomonas sp. LP_7_YM]TDV71931.1 hypothetical protein EC915_10164 [Pseudomonas sp. LP_7_YM]